MIKKEPIIQNREVNVFHATLLSGQDVTKCVVGMNETWGKLTTKGGVINMYSANPCNTQVAKWRPVSAPPIILLHELSHTTHQDAVFIRIPSLTFWRSKEITTEVLNQNCPEEKETAGWQGSKYTGQSHLCIARICTVQCTVQILAIHTDSVHTYIYIHTQCTYNLHCTNNDKGTSNHFCCMTNELSHSTPQTSAGWLWSKAPTIIFAWPMSFPTQY